MRADPARMTPETWTRVASGAIHNRIPSVKRFSLDTTLPLLQTRFSTYFRSSSESHDFFQHHGYHHTRCYLRDLQRDTLTDRNAKRSDRGRATERTESEQEEGMGEMEEREPEMELQVEYEIYESNTSIYQP
jgi:hypothetical protein